MTRAELIAHIRRKNSFLCVGIDPVLEKLPDRFANSADPFFDFAQLVVEGTHDLCVGYKLNTAFYEAHGSNGWKSLERTIEFLPDDAFVIADAKRGDIGNSSEKYARAFLEELAVDAVTVSPYLGRDSIEPFLSYEDKWSIILALTSNQGSSAFQLQHLENGSMLYEEVVKECSTWGSAENTMFVAGGTQPEQLGRIRQLVPDHFLLVPGVGAQGGDLRTVCQAAMTKDCGLLVNVSRGIIYAEDVRKAAQKYQNEMADLLA